MINLTCTSCHKLLQIDDAFAGGVCRCKFCGTIQTVPSQKTTRAASPTAAGVAPKAPPPPKTLFKSSSAATPVSHHHAPPPAGSGLDELAQIVASSGLAGTGLRAPHLRKPAAPPPTKSRLYLIIGGGVLGVLIVVLLIWMIVHSGADYSNQTGNANPQPARGDGGNSAPQVPQTPNYMGLPLTGPSVIYLLDRGSGTLETFDYMKRGAVRSIASLGAGSKFQIIFWETDSIIEFPQGAMRYATAENVAATDEAIKDVYAFSQSTIEKSFEKAMTQKPAEVVIVTGKYGLDDEWVNSVMAIRKNSPVKVHTLALGKSGSPDALKKLAEKTGGQFKEVSGTALAEYAN